MESKVFFEGEILHAVLPESIDEAIANKMIHDELELIEEKNNGRPVLLLVDLAKCKSISSEARKVLSTATDMDEFRRIALLGGTIFIRTVSNFIFRMSKKGDKARFFGDRKAALDWLDAEG